jgi:D-alanyl-D-alanine carboxypeptidase
VLWEEHSQDERSIASITKVMTAVVFLESATDLDREVQIVRADTLAASTTFLRTNDRVKLSDLLHLLLLPSDNAPRERWPVCRRSATTRSSRA